VAGMTSGYPRAHETSYFMHSVVATHTNNYLLFPQIARYQFIVMIQYPIQFTFAS
jgi:hypothetical protein